MKKRLLTASLIALCATAAHAEVNVDIGIGGAPVYVAPAPVYEPVYINDRHRHYDWSYWREREARERALREEAERREDWERSHEHHGKGHAYGHYKH